MNKYSDNDWRSYQELYHHGILGQKWGVRRFQNADGSLTAAGKERYRRGGTKEYNLEKYGLSDLTVIHKIPNSYKSAMGAGFKELDYDQLENICKLKQQEFEAIQKNCRIDEKTGLPLKNKTYSLREDMMYVNPLYNTDIKYQYNCAYCSVAMEARRRGFEVQAGTNKVGLDRDQLLSTFPTSDYGMYRIVDDDKSKCADFGPMPKNVQTIAKKYPKINASVNELKLPPPQSGSAEEKIEMDAKNKQYRACKNAILKQGDGAKGIFIFDWNSWGNHAVNYEVVDGQIKLGDSQCNLFGPIEEMSIKWCRGFEYIRTDNISDDDINWAKVKEVTK